MSAGTVLVTGPTGGLGRSAVAARAAGATAHAIGADLARLADVRAAAARAR